MLWAPEVLFVSSPLLVCPNSADVIVDVVYILQIKSLQLVVSLSLFLIYFLLLCD